MTGQALINHITMICKKHNIDPNVLKIKFEGKDLDCIPDFDKETNILSYSHLNYLKENKVD